MYSSFYRRSFVIATTAIMAYLLFRVLDPLGAALGWAAVLAFLLLPLHERLTGKLKGRSVLSASILTGLTPFCVMAPVSILAVSFAGQVIHLLNYMRSHTLLSYSEVLQRLEGYSFIGGAVHWARENAPISAEQVQSWISDGAQTALRSAATMGGSVALGVFGTLISFVMMLFLLFFFLQGGPSMLKHLTRLIPMEPVRRGQLLKYLADVIRAVVFGSTATALIQGIFVGVGFAIVGLPSPIVFGVLATIAAFLPAGAAAVLIPAVIYLMIDGRWGAAIFMAFWTAAMWVVENVLRPLLTAHRAEVSTLAIFVGAIGGASTFGVLGLVIGPVLLSFAVALVRFAEENVPQA
ncbi:MAG TPA: AI-2E family transporter [Steroidobacteraceae bacterium]|nr:AI-2E family transporter [Steroidobacteraceae bacterium]